MGFLGGGGDGASGRGVPHGGGEEGGDSGVGGGGSGPDSGCRDLELLLGKERLAWVCQEIP